MLRPSIFGESFLNDWNDWDNWMNFSFPDVEKKLYGKHAAHVMKTDIKEHDDGYELVVDLPGFKKDQVQVELKDGYLTISAEKGLEKDDNEKKGKYLRQERYSGSTSRTFYVGEDVTENDIHGKFENGILTLDIPKKEEKKEVEANHFITIEGQDKKSSLGSPGELFLNKRKILRVVDLK